MKKAWTDFWTKLTSLTGFPASEGRPGALSMNPTDNSEKPLPWQPDHRPEKQKNNLHFK
jgi:hypothetical protein